MTWRSRFASRRRPRRFQSAVGTKGAGKDFPQSPDEGSRQDESRNRVRKAPPSPVCTRFRAGRGEGEVSKTSQAGAMTVGRPGFLTIAEAGRLIAAKKLSPVELARATLQRIQAIDPKLNSYLLVTEKQALAAARAAERAIMSGRKGPLLGIPVAYKDIYETAGVRTTAHSRVLIDNIPKQDAEVVRRLHEAGTVMLGKLATHEFAIGGPASDLPWPPARNPWDTRCYTGGPVPAPVPPSLPAWRWGLPDPTQAARSACRRPIAASPA